MFSPNKIGTLIAPQLFDHIPHTAQWLSGIGAGTWFVLTQETCLSENEFRIRRYSAEGELECDRVFMLTAGNSFNFMETYRFTYISHCQTCKIEQGGKVYQFDYIKNF